VYKSCRSIDRFIHSFARLAWCDEFPCMWVDRRENAKKKCSLISISMSFAKGRFLSKNATDSFIKRYIVDLERRCIHPLTLLPQVECAPLTTYGCTFLSIQNSTCRHLCFFPELSAIVFTPKSIKTKHRYVLPCLAKLYSTRLVEYSFYV
jgi:hypothetical protein